MIRNLTADRTEQALDRWCQDANAVAKSCGLESSEVEPAWSGDDLIPECEWLGRFRTRGDDFRNELAEKLLEAVARLLGPSKGTYVVGEYVAEVIVRRRES